VDDVVVHLRDFAAHFLSRSQMQLDSFAGAALEDTEDGRIRLQDGFFLGEQTGTADRCNDDSEKK
jgi:hypothetical protein